MNYSIGEVARKLDIPTSTLRYYDREGLFAHIKRSEGGIRVFTDVELSALSMVECLKASGLQIKEIKQFLNWVKEGEGTIEKRQNLYYERKEALQQQLDDLQETMSVIEYKCWYYDTAIELGSEQAVRAIPVEEMPEIARKGKAVLESVFTK